MKSFDSLIGPAARAAMREDGRIRAVISRIVPKGALDHVRFCRLANRQLKVTLDSAAWIPKLRFTERALLAALIRDGLEVRAVSWHVAPAKNPQRREATRRRTTGASARAARSVRSAANALASNSGSDKRLALQLRRMAQHLEGTGNRGPGSDS